MARVLAFLGGLIALGVSIFVGAVFIAALVGVVLLGTIFVLARGWWLRRKMERYAREHGDLKENADAVSEIDLIEAQQCVRVGYLFEHGTDGLGDHVTHSEMFPGVLPERIDVPESLVHLEA